MQCPPLTITFLGTGTSSGVPMIGCGCEVCTSANTKDQRLRSSILVQSATTTLVVDTTPDFRYQMLRAGVRQLDAVLFTHPHKDHIAGLDDVRAYNFFQQRPMDIFCNRLTEAALHKEFGYAFAESRYPGVPNLEVHLLDDEETFWVGDIPVQKIMVWHLRMPVLGFRFGNFCYITDANRIEAESMEQIANADTLVLNALRQEKHISHYSLTEAIDVAVHAASRNTYLTHISHQMGLHEAVNAGLPPGVQLAWDGLQLTFPAYLPSS